MRSSPPAMRPPVGDRRAAFELVAPRPRRPATSWPRCAATSSTSAWLTRLDLPEPDTPVTVGEHAERKRRRRDRCRLLRVTPRQPQPAVRRAAARRRSHGAASRTDSARVCDAVDARAGPRAARCRGPRPPCSPASGPTSTIQSAWRITSSSCSTTKSELPEAFSRSSARSSASVSAGMQARGGLVEHVDDAEQIGADLGREPQALQLARRQRRRAAIERE